MKIAIITGSAGLIGSQTVSFFHDKGFHIIGIDNNMRAYFFGDKASTNHSKKAILDKFNNYTHYNYDIRNFSDLEKIFNKYNSDIKIIVHTAAQPSHDWATKEPLTDFTINANGTLNLLELTRKYCNKASFIFTSTNKVYGDTPNYLPLQELETRYEYFGNNKTLSKGINETMSIDQSKHSVFGASKVAADIMTQEYGRYFNMNTVCFRGGCLTGPNHAGTELHGFLSYLVKCIVKNTPYTIFGYKGKQVRDNIHSYDLVQMFWNYHQKPRAGEVYNVGGGRKNSISILEAIDKINKIAGTNWNKYTLLKNNREGDHMWYITDLSKFKKHYPKWAMTINLNETIKQMVLAEQTKT